MLDRASAQAGLNSRPGGWLTDPEEAMGLRVLFAVVRGGSSSSPFGEKLIEYVEYPRIFSLEKIM
jgi:hypothetical protein